MPLNPTLREQILFRLMTVLDPETGMNVISMRLIEDLHVDEQGIVHYRFRPSSPLCPIALELALNIKRAIAEIPGVQGQEIEVAGYIRAAELQALINQQD